MRRLLIAIAAVALMLVLAAAGGAVAKDPRVAVDEAARLETRALTLYKSDPNDPEVEELINRSIETMRHALTGDNQFDYRAFSIIAQDRLFLQKKADPKVAITELFRAIYLKEDLIHAFEYLGWPGGPQGRKHAKRTPVSPPSCRRSLAALNPSGCYHVDTWDINVDRNAKRAHCVFNGPGGELRADKPLFPGTLQRTSCKLTGRTVLVGGVRKRVVRAELRITLPEGVTAKGSKIVRVTAVWQ